MMRSYNYTKLLFAALAVLVVGCAPEADIEVELTEGDISRINREFLLPELPETVLELNEVLNSSSPEDTLVFTGRVGGTVEPMIKGYAAFVVADESLVFCDEMSNKGHCSTPWDACCEDKDKRLASRALVQFVDDDGSLLAMDLKEAIGLSENDTVIVRGRLSPDSLPSNPIIIAEGLIIN